MEIDPRLREQVQNVPQSYSILPQPQPIPHSHNHIRLPPPSPQQTQQQPGQPQQQQPQQQQKQVQHQQQQHQQQHQQQQQHHSSLPPPQLQQSQHQHHNSLTLPPQHHNSLPPWPQEPSHPYYNLRAESQAHSLGQPDIQSHDSLLGASQQSDEGPAESKRPRACEACRGLKVKCDPDPTKSACRRCAKAGRICVVTAPCRKRQKKTDSRVEELEKKINSLEAILNTTNTTNTTRNGPTSGSEDGGSYEEGYPYSSNQHKFRHERTEGMRDRGVENAGKYDQPSHLQSIFLDYRPEAQYQIKEDNRQGLERSPGTANTLKRRRSEYDDEDGRRSSTFAARRHSNKSFDSGNINPLFSAETRSGACSSITAGSSAPSHEYADIIDKKILDAPTAAKIFSYYTNNMAVHMPIVVIPPDVTAGMIRKNKPTLFLAILSVASAQDYPDLQGILTREIMNAYADRLICKHEMSLELVQALQVSTTWYSKDANFYQLIHLAATMGIELGISTRTKTHKERILERWKDNLRAKTEMSVKENLESQRAWLGCYFLCANAAMGSRRQNLIRWTPYMDECLHDLEKSSVALPSDKVFCQWVRLQKLADDLGAQISTDEISHTDISDQKTQYALKGFEKQLVDWEKQKSVEITSSTLTLGSHVVNLYMHDFAIPLDHGLENMKPGGPNKNQDKNNIPLSAAHVATLTTCLTSIHGIFDTFLGLGVSGVRALPVFHFARLARASVLLIRMYFAATTPDSALGNTIPGDHMKVEHYLDGLISLLRAGASEGNCHPARQLSIVLVQLESNFKRTKERKLGLLDESAVALTKSDARPIDSPSHDKRQEYERVKLEGDDNGYPTGRLSPPGKAQNLNSPQQQQQAQLLAPTSTAGDDALQLLSEVAMGNSAPNGQIHHHAQQQHQQQCANNSNNNDASGWYGPYNENSHSNSSNGGPAPPAQPPPPYATDSNHYYDQAVMDPGRFNNHSGLAASFEQVIEMTLGDGGDLSIMDDVGFYHIMQTAPPGIIGSLG